MSYCLRRGDLLLMARKPCDAREGCTRQHTRVYQARGERSWEMRGVSINRAHGRVRIENRATTSTIAHRRAAAHLALLVQRAFLSEPNLLQHKCTLQHMDCNQHAPTCSMSACAWTSMSHCCPASRHEHALQQQQDGNKGMHCGNSSRMATKACTSAMRFIQIDGMKCDHLMCRVADHVRWRPPLQGRQANLRDARV